MPCACCACTEQEDLEASTKVIRPASVSEERKLEVVWPLSQMEPQVRSSVLLTGGNAPAAFRHSGPATSRGRIGIRSSPCPWTYILSTWGSQGHSYPSCDTPRLAFPKLRATADAVA